MRREPAGVLPLLITGAVPLILVGNALWLLINPWLVDVEYALPGFPDTPGLSKGERSELADAGIDSIRPAGDGVELLREARLPSGDPAFEQREISHMDDVRGLVAAVLAAWAIALTLAFGVALWLRRRGDPDAVRRALGRGAGLTLGAMTVLGLVMLIDFEFFFDGFHAVFFEGDSWRFNETYTLRQLYPDFFWGVAGAALAAFVLIQAVALALVVRRREGGE